MVGSFIKNKVNTKRVLFGILGVVAVVFIAILSLQFVVKPLLAVLPTWGATTIGTSMSAPDWAVKLLGADIFQSYNTFVVFLCVFLIMLFAMADILTVFSTFSEGTAWAISIALGIIGVMTGTVNKMIIYIFGGAAAFGALGIAIIIVWAVIIAVIMNIMVGLSGIKAMRQAKIDQSEVNKVASNLRKGYGVFKAGAEIAEDS
jgi:hypothetical protein